MDRNRKTGSPVAKRYWYLAVGGSVLVHVVGLMIFRIEPVPESLLLVERPYLTLSESPRNEARGTGFDRVALLDTAPLFLPSQWNTESGNLETIHARKPGDLFEPFPPELSFADSGAAAELSLRLQNTVDPREIILERRRFPFGPFGRADRESEAASTRFARIEVLRFDDGESVRRFEIPATEVSDVFDDSTYPAEPLVFSVQVSAIGVLGSFFIVESSGSDEIDRFFRGRLHELLRDTFRRDGGLEAGYYRVEIGP